MDLVVGVSMGSIIGAGYAAGLAPATMAELARAIRIGGIFRPRPGRLGLVDPSAMRDVLVRVLGERRFADLDRELVVVSASVTTGQPVAIRDGPVVDALVASCAIPLVFPPVSRDGHDLLDGGLIEAVPIQVARELGARRIVAVDVSGDVRHLLRLPGVRHATRGVVHVLRRRRPRARLDAIQILSRLLHHAVERPPLPEAELLIRPAFGLRSTFHYHRAPEMIALGRAAAEAVRPELASLGAAARAADQAGPATIRRPRQPNAVNPTIATASPSSTRR